ncbi:MAG TPA: O-antigen ligase family protein [Tepidisphaeraceae bacterium]|nr:O-antigen ligase family protein [Tepidisphaeraceae bacterium]
MKCGDRYFRLLAFLLLGYATIGKSVAYIGVPPLYVGEAVLLYGIYALMRQRNWSRILLSGLMIPMALLFAWGTWCTVPYVSKYGADAFRDAAIWGWGLFAIVTGSLLAAEPRRLRWLIDNYARFATIFLIVAPITWFMSSKMETLRCPWANVPIVEVKGGDMVVHVMAILAYAILLGGVRAPLVSIMGAAVLAVNFTGRASMMIFLMGATIVTLIKPYSKILLGVIGAFAAGVFVMWVLNISIQVSPDSPRKISVEQFVENIDSVAGDSGPRGLQGSKAWRLAWWNKIIDYTVHGPYFWTGKGFGINLANADGFQVNADDSLRAPHNGHLNMLARSGVPGFCLWVIVQISWAGAILWATWQARRNGHQRWSHFFMFLFIYWTAFMTNASFDVYLESPLGGIWMWVVYGVGLGSRWIYAHAPEVLEDDAPRASLYVRKDQPAEALAV